ncbi:hypothetical protein FVEG_10209 [Fusarium verticillioides 7600]|uniref:WIF domain-containing protein n=1 Tax=Gibberella moniliformis (strain M3125 / FGSC 7600) TaxID=334819 RepID=W7MTV4_GIBM7|nr:hypothetical protein FVEG_10209 [Fusarium verticillioides 7600]EWG51120.1 hypothetical protein FVEG_10209 [Fusarium verticillioides 7600]
MSPGPEFHFLPQSRNLLTSVAVISFITHFGYLRLPLKGLLPVLEKDYKWKAWAFKSINVTPAEFEMDLSATPFSLDQRYLAPGDETFSTYWVPVDQHVAAFTWRALGKMAIIDRVLEC